MLPDWFFLMLDACTCEQCGKQLDLEDVIEVGVAYPDTRAKYDQRPLTFARMACQRCHTIVRVLSIEHKDDTLHLVNDYYDLIELDREATEEKPPFKCNGRDEPKPPKSGPFEMPDRREREPRRVTPSRRDGHPPEPMSAGEITQFFQLLRRTSMRRDSVSFRRFMKRLDVPLDGEPPTGSDDEDGDADAPA